MIRRSAPVDIDTEFLCYRKIIAMSYEEKKGLLRSLEITKGVVGWVWIASCIAALYFLARAVFYDKSWIYFGVSAACALVLFRVTHMYQRRWEKEVYQLMKEYGMLPPGIETFEDLKKQGAPVAENRDA